jgi:hypothetical protein
VDCQEEFDGEVLRRKKKENYIERGRDRERNEESTCWWEFFFCYDGDDIVGLGRLFFSFFFLSSFLFPFLLSFHFPFFYSFFLS